MDADDAAAGELVPTHDPDRRHAPMMATTDIALRTDPSYEAISRRYHENLDEFADAFARAWFKLTHRDMGPKSRYVGALVPDEDLIWQDPIPAADHAMIDAGDVTALKASILETGLSVAELVGAAWASASTFRGSDKRGGANGGRIRLAPQRDWAVNQPAQLDAVLTALEGVQAAFNGSAAGGKQVSMADLIVLGGCAAIEKAAANAGQKIEVPFTPGRTDAAQEQTDIESFAVLEPLADGFRNYLQADFAVSAEELLLDKAQLMTLSAPEMTVLVGGMRVLNANMDQAAHGVFTDKAETLSTDFFVNLLDMGTEWKPASAAEDVFEGRDRDTGGQVDRHAGRSGLDRTAAARCRKSMPARVRKAGSLPISSPPGQRSWIWTGSTWPDACSSETSNGAARSRRRFHSGHCHLRISPSMSPHSAVLDTQPRTSPAFTRHHWVGQDCSSSSALRSATATSAVASSGSA